MCICVQIYIYIYSLLKKVWDFIWVPYLNPYYIEDQVPTLSTVSINLSTYVSIHASNYKYIYIYMYVFIYTYIYIHIDTRMYVCTCICFESV